MGVRRGARREFDRFGAKGRGCRNGAHHSAPTAGVLKGGFLRGDYPRFLKAEMITIPLSNFPRSIAKIY